jgi:hypothetical protein
MPPDPASADSETWRRSLRLALAIALSLTLAEAREAVFGFMTALFALQMMVKSPRPPSLQQGFGFAIVLIVATHVALTLTGALLHRPVAYLIIIGLVFWACFYLQARGKGGPLPQLLLVCNAMLPVLAVQDQDLAVDFANIMVEAAIGAPLVVWLVHGLLPSRRTADDATTPAAAPQVATDAAPGRSLLAALVLLLPFAWYMAQGEGASFVILMTCIGIASQAPAMQGRAAGGLLLGNLLGGIAASLAYFALTLLPSLVLLFLLTLLVGLVFASQFNSRIGSRVAGAAALAPVFVIAMTTFLILLGLGLAPVGAGSAAGFIARIADVALASVYAIGVIILFAAPPPQPLLQPGEREHA